MWRTGYRIVEGGENRINSNIATYRFRHIAVLSNTFGPEQGMLVLELLILGYSPKPVRKWCMVNVCISSLTTGFQSNSQTVFLWFWIAKCIIARSCYYSQSRCIICGETNAWMHVAAFLHSPNTMPEGIHSL